MLELLDRKATLVQLVSPVGRHPSCPITHTTTLLPVSTIGDLVWNTAGQTDATLIYLSHRQVGGQDVERILEIATTGSTLLIQADDNSGRASIKRSR